MSLDNKPGMLDNKLQKLRRDYLDLMESCLTGVVFRDVSHAPFGPNTFDSHLREHGLDWPAQALTMIGSKRMANLRALTESVLAENVPGDLIETGVWRGGSCIMMRAILYAHGIADRRVWVADSFEGLPAPDDAQYPADAGSDFHVYEQLSVSLQQVQNNFRAYALLDDQAKFLKGWFKDTLPTVPVERFALLRLDGDMYESTMDALVNLYPKLSDRGYVVIDDYHVVPACKAAVHDYWKTIGIQPEVFEIDGVGVYWKKRESDGPANIGVDPGASVIPSAVQVVRLSDALINLDRNVIAMLGKSLADRDSAAGSLSQLLAERDSAVEALGKTLVERDSAVEALGKTLAERTSAVEALGKTLAERTSAVEALGKTLAERTSDVEALNNTLAERDGTVEALSRSVAERDSTVESLTQSLAERHADVEALNQSLTELYSSTSWRVTKPLRSIKEALGGKRMPADKNSVT